MNAWAAAAILANVIGVFAMTAGVGRRNRGGARLCPRCRYDLSGSTGSPCSECGYAWSDEMELLRRPARRSMVGAGVLSLAFAIVFGVVSILSLRHWTHAVPRPILSWALTQFVTDEPVVPGATLPAPNPAFKHSSDRWERLVWQQQAALVFERFFEQVETSDGSLDAIERLTPAATEVNALMKEIGGTRSSDAWLSMRTVRELRERRAELDERFDLPLGTWAAAELQFFYGDSARRYPDWIPPPLKIHAALAESPDAAVRSYALLRLTYLPAAAPVIERMANEDPDPKLRHFATEARIWQTEFMQWP